MSSRQGLLQKELDFFTLEQVGQLVRFDNYVLSISIAHIARSNHCIQPIYCVAIMFQFLISSIPDALIS